MLPTIRWVAVDFMKTHGLKGNVLADYAWGQYVIWHAAPDSKVFIDSRYDLGYPPAVVADYMELERGAAGGAHTLAAYRHDFDEAGEIVVVVRFLAVVMGAAVLDVVLGGEAEAEQRGRIDLSVRHRDDLDGARQRRRDGGDRLGEAAVPDEVATC